MKILYIASNPPTAHTLEIEQEISLLQSNIDEVPTIEPVDVRVYGSLRVDELPTVIARVAPDVIHFAAHGKDKSIVLAHAERGHVKLDGADLADLLRSIAVRPKLIVVNACSSDQFAAQLSTAADFAIGTDAPITNIGARSMAATLYQRLAMSSSLLSSFEAARTMLRIIDGGAVETRLFPLDSRDQAQRTTLTEPLRILCCFPEIDKRLSKNSATPGNDFDVRRPYVQFGIAGAPADMTQLVFFTDDETFVPKKGQSMEWTRSWIIEKRPIRGEVWIEDWNTYWGDVQWYASIVTAGGRIFSAAAAMSDAIIRYYFEEQWRGTLPAAIEDAVRRAVLELVFNDGARRAASLPGGKAFPAQMARTSAPSQKIE